ncbi:programmed cell death protein 1-like isoform X2 [Rhinatrema bivittatum]|uniref:programmed cell death protein 1-like isoform X2 n=1 Tax=Rhinatrema bivittatum TaxID=194408 RepID=UPI00112B1839|nr:programmed cell death protein 1-like isoform X2 [Rhinatrema bivittatum]
MPLGRFWCLPVERLLDETLLLRHSSPELLQHPGETVRFYCNISMVNYSYADVFISWHKVHNHSKPEKIVQLSLQNVSAKDQRFDIRWNAPTHAVELSIRDLWQNDSGSYYCELINTKAQNRIIKSNLLNLSITDKVEMLSTVTPHTSNVNVPISVISSVIAIMLLLLLGYVLFLLLRKAEENKKLQSENKHSGQQQETGRETSESRLPSQELN